MNAPKKPVLPVVNGFMSYEDDAGELHKSPHSVHKANIRHRACAFIDGEPLAPLVQSIFAFAFTHAGFWPTWSEEERRFFCSRAECPKYSRSLVNVCELTSSHVSEVCQPAVGAVLGVLTGLRGPK